MARPKGTTYNGYLIYESRGDWYVDKDGEVVASVWSRKDGKRWVDTVLAEAERIASDDGEHDY